MREFQSCMGQNGVQVSDASCSSVGVVSKASQNLVSCIYQCKLFGKSCLIIINWSKNLMGQCLSIEIDDISHQCLCKVDIKPSLFLKRKGSKCLELNCGKIELYWDLSQAKFGSGPEALEGYYLAIVCKGKMVLIVGDLKKEALRKTNSTPALSKSMLISKREHVFGKKLYATKTRFFDIGLVHDLVIECDTIGCDDPSLVIRIDGKTVMKVKHLQWKFRGNYTALVDGLPVEIFWDVHYWLFGGTNLGSAVFMFQTCSSAGKLWTSQHYSSYDTSLVSWTESFKESKTSSLGVGFSLVLYAWKNE
ncbi:hypothetical protein LIER_43307 [Lithospermum erythrorhizon]|uniref:Uncharacterized protein n=1 Tax=Lithospermum erythrorhizon TaxID=34254 RepID=A0AAV3PY56_LITER